MRKRLFLFLFSLAAFTAEAQTVVNVSQPGTLSSLVGEDNVYSVTSLKVKGAINGTDVRFLRRMAGADSIGNQTKGSLSTLDLSEARIVNGGSAYYRQMLSEVPKGMGHSAQQLAKMMGCGWNLGNSLEVPSSNLSAETGWNNPVVTQLLIDSVKQAGFTTVRIPVSWNVHMNANGKIDPDWMARVKEVVDYCINDDMFVILNCHYDDNWLQTKGFTDLSDKNVDSVATKQYNIWHQIAEAFAAYDEHLLFAGTNEPTTNSGVAPSAATQAALDKYLQAFVNAVRSTGGKNKWRTLIVQPLNASALDALKYTKSLPVDSVEGRMMFEFHFYDPNLFSLFSEDQRWGKCIYYWGADNHLSGSTRNASADKENSYIESLFKKMYDRFSSQGIPVVLGEYAAMWRNLSSQTGEDQDKHDASIRAWNYCVTKTALKYGMVPCYWDPGARKKPTMGIFKRAKGAVFDNYALAGIMQAKEEYGVPAQNVSEETEKQYTTGKATVGDYMFASCNALKQVTLPSGTLSIGASAFQNCANLQVVDMGSCLNAVGKLSFDKCDNLKEIDLSTTTPPVCQADAFSVDKSAAKLYIPNSALSAYTSHEIWKDFSLQQMEIIPLQDSTLQVSLNDDERLEDVIPEAQTYMIENHQMIAQPCKGNIVALTVSGALNGSDYRYLTEMLGKDVYGNTVSGSLKTLDLSNTTVIAGGQAYKIDKNSGANYFTSDDVFPSYVFGYTNIGRITLPSTVTSVGNGALISCINLKSVTMPDAITSIGDSAISYCSSLNNITLPKSLTEIGAFSFMNLPAVDVTIPDGVTKIGQRAFASSKIQKLTIGNAVAEIGSQAFRGSTSLTSINVFAVTPPTCADDAFKWIDKSKIQLLVPKGTITAYQSAIVWKDFTNIVEMSDEVTGISAVTGNNHIGDQIFTTDGRRTTKNYRGVQIIRNGKRISKLINKK